MQKPKLVVARKMPEAVRTRIEAEYDAPCPGTRDLEAEDVLRQLEETGAEALMFSSHLKFDAGMIASLPARLRIAATTSVGHDHIDLAAARAKKSDRDQHAGRAHRLHRRPHHAADLRRLPPCA